MRSVSFVVVIFCSHYIRRVPLHSAAIAAGSNTAAATPIDIFYSIEFKLTCPLLLLLKQQAK